MGIVFSNSLVIVNGYRITNPARLPILLPLKLVVRAGIAPAVFLVWRVYSPLRSLLR